MVQFSTLLKISQDPGNSVFLFKQSSKVNWVEWTRRNNLLWSRNFVGRCHLNSVCYRALRGTYSTANGSFLYFTSFIDETTVHIIFTKGAAKSRRFPCREVDRRLEEPNPSQNAWPRLLRQMFASCVLICSAFNGDWMTAWQLSFSSRIGVEFVLNTIEELEKFIFY